MASSISHVPDIESDIRERSFQNIIKNIFIPAGVKMGGYTEELFINLDDDEREDWTCGICYLIVREAVSCDNSHYFCNTCAFAWSMTHSVSSQMCPMCRNKQNSYQFRKDIDERIEEKEVQCLEKDCSFSAPLKILLMHNHGKIKYKNTVSDLESLRPPQHNNGLNLVLQRVGTHPERYTGLRDQLTRGRVMVSQMMLLLQLEMQLRQQAMIGYVQASNPNMRVQHLDEVLALNEQLNEVGSILGHILHDPRNQRGISLSPNNHSTFRIPNNSNRPPVDDNPNISLPHIDTPRPIPNEISDYQQNTSEHSRNSHSQPRDNGSTLLSQSNTSSSISNTVETQSLYNDIGDDIGSTDNTLSTPALSNNQNSRTHLPPINSSTPTQRTRSHPPNPEISNENRGQFTLTHSESNGRSSQTNEHFESQLESSYNERLINANEMDNSSYHHTANDMNNNICSDMEINALQTDMNISPNLQVTTTRTYSAQRHISRPARRDQSAILHARRLSHSTVPHAPHPPHHPNPRVNESQSVNQHIHTLRRNASNRRNRQQSEMQRTSTLQNSNSTATNSQYRPRRRSEIRDQMLNQNSLQIKKK